MLGDLGKLIVAKGFKKLPKVQKIARSGHTGKYHRLAGLQFYIIISFNQMQTSQTGNQMYLQWN